LGKPLSVTQLIENYKQGDEGALGELLPQVYEQLKKIANAYLRKEKAGHTLQPSALVNEAFLKLVEMKEVRWESRAHFLASTAKIMRWVLMDHAKAKRREKRGGGQLRVTFQEGEHAKPDEGLDYMALDHALEQLAATDERRARVVELRFFGGLSVEETAEVLSTSPATVKRDWTLAKAWLFRELSKNDSK
jgi:RNA polymerase sigma-70 factor, ECF subfamily